MNKKFSIFLYVHWLFHLEILLQPGDMANDKVVV